MPAAVRSRSRTSDRPVGPPAKKARTSYNAPAKGLEEILLSNKSGNALKAVTTNGVGGRTSHRIDDSRAVVGRQEQTRDPQVQEVIEVESSSSSDDDDEDSEDGDDLQDSTKQQVESIMQDFASENKDAALTSLPQLNGHQSPRADNSDDDDNDEGAETAQPSFGELLQSAALEPIDAEAPFAHLLDEPSALVPGSSSAAAPGSRSLTAPPTSALGTVLTQALRTNDKALLESCLEENNFDAIRATIQRLPSALVGNLIQSLAERMYRRPGRAGNLMVWVQWSFVAHGGYLAGQPRIVNRMKGLLQVMKDRASSLPRLLPLKGRLDLIAAQMDLRKSMQKGAGGGNDVEEEAVIYVEGEEDEESDNENRARRRRASKGKSKSLAAGGEAGSDDESGADEPMTYMINGISSDAADQSAGESDDEDLIDDEAEESSAEETDDDGIEEDDEDELEEDEGDEVESDMEPEPVERVKRSNAVRARSGFAGI